MELNQTLFHTVSHPSAHDLFYFEESIGVVLCCSDFALVKVAFHLLPVKAFQEIYGNVFDEFSFPNGENFPGELFVICTVKRLCSEVRSPDRLPEVIPEPVSSFRTTSVRLLQGTLQAGHICSRMLNVLVVPYLLLVVFCNAARCSTYALVQSGIVRVNNGLKVFHVGVGIVSLEESE